MTSGENAARTARPTDGEARVRVGVIGCGYWGPHLIRNLHETTEADQVAVSDRRPDRLGYVAEPLRAGTVHGNGSGRWHGDA